MFNEIIFIQEAQSLEYNAIELLDRILEIEFEITNNDTVSLKLIQKLEKYTKEYDETNERLSYLNSIIGLNSSISN